MYYFCSTIQEYVTMKYSLSVKGRSVVVGSLVDELPHLLPNRRVVVISDLNLDRYHHSLLAQYEYILISQGETSKTLHTVDKIYRQFIEMGVDRSTFILGIGGGIVTDVTGFVASTFMRGLEFGFVSTTLLGQVDASVGGKNGVNVDGYKNMVGTFNQPKFVICDVDMLSTLSEREFRTGLAEMIKAGVIADSELFERMEACTLQELRQNREMLKELVYRAIKVKADIVERDEREAGDRRKLNLGHTLAHAIEKCSSKMNHGEAVAVGLSLIADAAWRSGALEEEDKARIDRLLLGYGFSITPPVEVRRLLKEVKRDKKSEGEAIYIVLPTKIGECRVDKMSLADFKAMF